MTVGIMVTSNLKSLLDGQNIGRLQAGERPWSLRQFAKGCGLPTSVVSNLYSNKTTRADFDTLSKLCDYLQCTPGDILIYTRNQ